MLNRSIHISCSYNFFVVLFVLIVLQNRYDAYMINCHSRSTKCGIVLRDTSLKSVNDDFPSKIKEYIPKKTFSGKIYKPRSVGVEQKRQKSSESIVLANPQLLIRFRAPRIKSEMKVQLEELQNLFVDSSASRSSYNEDSKDSFYDNFLPPVASVSEKKSSSKGRGQLKEVEKRLEPSRGKKRSSKDDDFDDYDDDDEGAYEEDASDYYGDESNVSLSTVPFGALQNMQNEGYTLEDIQLALYGEYGVKASLNALKKRLLDDKFARKTKKKTGKTKKERTKARNARYSPVESAVVLLPQRGSIQVQELAILMNISSGELIKHLMLNMGIMASMTQNIDISVAKSILEAFDLDYTEEQSNFSREDEAIESIHSDLIFLPRNPVVTIMGHVDHGKTSLLDKIRSANVAKNEAGGITQAVSAFSVTTKLQKNVTFIDTPGHAAFSDMRRRGANATDIVILVVAADDGVMDQTRECIAAAKSVGCPVVVAINKIDKEGANVEKIKTDLMKENILVEDFGGDVQCVEVSAKNDIGIADLLEKVLLQAEVMNLSAAVNIPAEGIILEATLSKGMGTSVTAIIQRGILRVGDLVLAGPSYGRVKRLIDDQGRDIMEAKPATPVQIIGLGSVPSAGDTFTVVSNEAAAKNVAEARQRLIRQAVGSASSAAIIASAISLVEGETVGKEIIKLPVLVKADVAGSVEAVCAALNGLQKEDDGAVCKVDLVFSGVGDVTSSDVAMAAASKAKIVAFNVASAYSAMEEARASNVEIGYYDVVYNLLDEIDLAIKSIISPPPPGVLVGEGIVKQVFKLGRIGKIAGCEVLSGMLKMASKVRVLRGKRNIVYMGSFQSLKVVKDDAVEVPVGSECGLSFVGFEDFQEGDKIECFVTNSTN